MNRICMQPLKLTSSFGKDTKSITSELGESIAQEWLLDNLSQMNEEVKSRASCVLRRVKIEF